MRSCSTCQTRYDTGQRCPFCGGDLVAGCDARIGTSLAGYVIEQRISARPLTSVYRARRGAHEVAIKTYAPGGDHELLDARARREREAQSQVLHPAVARLLDWGKLPDGSAYLVSDWIAGSLLEERLDA